VLFASDLLELSGEDLGRTPLEERKRALGKLLHKKSDYASVPAPATGRLFVLW